MEDALIEEMAVAAVDWSDDQLASKVVELLIHDKGFVNAWDRTIKMAIKIIRKREQILLSRAM